MPECSAAQQAGKSRPMRPSFQLILRLGDCRRHHRRLSVTTSPPRSPVRLHVAGEVGPKKGSTPQHLQAPSRWSSCEASTVEERAISDASDLQRSSHVRNSCMHNFHCKEAVNSGIGCIDASVRCEATDSNIADPDTLSGRHRTA